MIVDAHCHIWERDLIKGDMVKLMDSAIQGLGLKDIDNAYNGSLERLIADMDEASIEKTVILPLDFEFLYAGGDFSYRDYNDLAGEYLRESPDRLIAFAGVDPRRGATAVAELKRCVEEMGFRGLKLWTITGFVPDDEAYYPLYEEAARLGVTVLVHTGMGPGYSYLKTCRPVYVDKIAVDFREVNLIMAHVGTPWVEEALAVAMKNPNVYVDISAWQKSYSLFPLGLAQVLSTAKLMHGGVQKVLLGTDWPLFTEIYSQKEWIECIREISYPPPLQIMGLPEITLEDKEMILGKNAQSVLGL
jgi:predicted TIM-barrel fold metal-dependent hydrolase